MNFKRIDFKDKKNWIFITTIGVMFLALLFFMRPNVSNDAIGTVYKFLNSKTIEEKLQYTLESDEAKKHLSNYDYDEIMKYVFGEDKIDLDSLVYELDYTVNEIKDGDTIRVKVYEEDGSGRYEDYNIIFYLKKVGEEFKIDLSPHYNYNSNDLLELLKNKSDESKDIKLYGKVDEYNCDQMYSQFKEENKYVESGSYSITLYDQKSRYKGQAFIKKGTKKSEYLYEYLKDGFKQVTLNISYNTEFSSIFDSFIINDVISYTWGDADEEFEFRDF